MDRRAPMVSCTRVFMRTMASWVAAACTSEICFIISALEASISMLDFRICSSSISSSLISIATIRLHGVFRSTTSSCLKRRVAPSPILMRISSSPLPSSPFCDRRALGISQRSLQSVLVFDRSVAKPSFTRHDRIASFMKSTSRCLFAHTIPSGKKLIASTMESFEMELER